MSMDDFLRRYQWLIFRRFALFMAITVLLLLTAPESTLVAR